MKKIVLFIAILELLIISVFVAEKYMSKRDFTFKSDTGAPFPYSFRFTFSKSVGTSGFIALDEDGRFASVFLEDAGGRSIIVGFNEGYIASYVISDKGYNYKTQTCFVSESLCDDKGKVILCRAEEFNSTEHVYFIDYNTSPYFFYSELPINLEFTIDKAN